MLKINSLSRGLFFSLFSFINRGISFVLLLILAKFINPAEYGYLSLFNTIIMLLTYFRSMSMEGYFSIAYFEKGEDGLKQTFSSLFYTSIFMLFFFFFFILIFKEQSVSILNLPFSIVSLTIIIVFFQLYIDLNLDYFRIFDKIKKYGAYSCGGAILNFILSIFFVKQLMLGWEGRVYAQLFCCFCLGLFSLLFFIKRRFLVLPDIKYFKHVLFWGIPLIPHLATTFIRQGCDRYIINAAYSIEDVGLFSFALTLMGIITMIGYGFNQANSVEVYRILGNKELSVDDKCEKLISNIKTLIRIYTFSSFLVVIFCSCIIPHILPQYSGAITYFIPLSIYGYGVCLYLIYVNFLFYYKKTHLIMVITISSAIIHLLLSLILTKYSLHFTSLIYIITQILVVFIIRRHAVKILMIKGINISFKSNEETCNNRA